MALIQRDGAGSVPTEIYWDEHTGETHINRVQDVEPVLERAKAMRASGWDGYNGERDMRATHEIPIVFLERWAAEGIDFFNPAHDGEIRKRLNDPALAGFRLSTTNANAGHVIVAGER